MLGFLANVLAPILTITTGSLCTANHPHFREMRYVENIAVCKRVVSKKTKLSVYKTYGVKPQDQKEFTIDHFIPLSLGGSNNFDNLWPQHKSIHSAPCEFKLYTKVRKGEMRLVVARDILFHVKVDGAKCE